jgi:rhodanese-related sulfurtransferase/DNA-directed RNA polymerase subunit RPC12/RpoP
MKHALKYLLFICITILSINTYSQTTAEKYVCIPCGRECDKEIHDKPGTCSHCQMVLVKKSTVTFTEIKPSDICAYIKEHPGVVLLDVRTKAEFEGQANPNFGSLKNAINIPIQELEARLTEIDSLKNKEIIVYCSHSHRSPRATYILSQHGFTKVKNMSGGMSTMNDVACKK